MDSFQQQSPQASPLVRVFDFRLVGFVATSSNNTTFLPQLHASRPNGRPRSFATIDSEHFSQQIRVAPPCVSPQPSSRGKIADGSAVGHTLCLLFPTVRANLASPGRAGLCLPTTHKNTTKNKERCLNHGSITGRM